MRSPLEVLRAGGVVACPTETQIGLLADALNPEAVERVVALKGRRVDQPIAVLLPSIDSLYTVAEPLPADLRARLAQYWPGPLTIVATARPGLPSALVRNDTIGLRVPGPSPALDLLRAFDGPLTATSANRSGEPATTTEADVRRVFGEEIAIVPGDAPGGLPSTVIDVTVSPAKVLRAGAIVFSES